MRRNGLGSLVIGAAVTLTVLATTVMPATTVTGTVSPSSRAHIPPCSEPPASLTMTATLGLCATTTGAGRLEIAPVTQIDCGRFTIVHVASVEHDTWGTTRAPRWSTIGLNCYTIAS